jgi:hypothetical protein
MSKKNDIIRENIFGIYKTNLEEIKNNDQFKFEPDFKDCYLCPICFDPFPKKDLSRDSPNFLTLEDVHPKSLGGNPKILTCKKCNSFCGYSLDNHLKQRLDELDIRNFLPNSTSRTTFSSKSNSINGQLNILNDGKMHFKFKKEWSNPKDSEHFVNDFFLSSIDPNLTGFSKPKFSMKFPEFSNERRAEIATLKIAYLLAFSIMGYGFLINPPLIKVREQILNPDKLIIPRVFWINHNFPENLIGVNLINSPNYLRCFLIIFNLKTKSKTRQFAIALPGPSEPGYKIYENIEKKLCADSHDVINFELQHITDSDFVTNKNKAWGAHWYWQKFCE